MLSQTQTPSSSVLRATSLRGGVECDPFKRGKRRRREPAINEQAEYCPCSKLTSMLDEEEKEEVSKMYKVDPIVSTDKIVTETSMYKVSSIYGDDV